MAILQAILPVAGLGTRFLPWTKTVPKELLPIGKEPIIALLVDEALSVGVREICFVISKGKEAIPEYFTDDPELRKELTRRGKDHLLSELSRYSEVQFHVCYQHEQKGDGHAILQAKDWVKSEPVAILFGDDLIVGKKTGLQEITDAYATVMENEKQPIAMLALENVPLESVSRYGIVDPETGPLWGRDISAPQRKRLQKIKGLIEKPSPENTPSTLAIVGKYLIPRSTFDVLPTISSGHGNEIRLIDALIAQCKDIPIYGYEFEGKRYDTGTPEGYHRAVLELG